MFCGWRERLEEGLLRGVLIEKLLVRLLSVRLARVVLHEPHFVIVWLHQPVTDLPRLAIAGERDVVVARRVLEPLVSLRLHFDSPYASL